MRIDYDPAAEDFVISHGTARYRFTLDETAVTLHPVLRQMKAQGDASRNKPARPNIGEFPKQYTYDETKVQRVGVTVATKFETAKRKREAMIEIELEDLDLEI